MSFSIRKAVMIDAPTMVQIERDAGQVFRLVEGLEWLSDSEGHSAESYAEIISSRTAWIAEDADAPCGFLAARSFPPDLHIVELSVRRANQRQGLARKLIEKAAQEARYLGLATLTLTTFRNVAWNEQLYTRLGFERLAQENLGERLFGELDNDAAADLPREGRCAMRLHL